MVSDGVREHLNHLQVSHWGSILKQAVPEIRHNKIAAVFELGSPQRHAGSSAQVGGGTGQSPPCTNGYSLQL